jgi:hypothetical protein
MLLHLISTVMSKDNRGPANSPAAAARQELIELTRRVSQLERNAVLTSQISATTAIEEPVEGEHIIDHTDNKHAWYVNGAWHKCADLPRARVWTTNNARQITVGPDEGTEIFPFNHGYTSDEEIMEVRLPDWYSGDEMMIYIKKGGVYAASYRLAPSLGANPNLPRTLHTELYEPDWMGFTSYDHNFRDGEDFEAWLIFTMRNDILDYWSENGQEQYLNIYVPSAEDQSFPGQALTFNKATSLPPDERNDNYMEITRLGDVDTSDINDGDEEPSLLRRAGLTIGRPLRKQERKVNVNRRPRPKR